MLGYKPVTKIAFSGIEPKFRIFFIKSSESLMYDHFFYTKGHKW